MSNDVMRVALYHSRLPVPGRKPGGAEVYVHRLAAALADHGHDVTAYAYVAPQPDTVSYRTRLLHPRWLGESKAARQYLGACLMNTRGFDPADVLHLFGDDWFFVRRRVPTVRTFLGSALFEALTAGSVRRRCDQALLFGLEQVAARLATAAYGIGPDSELLAGRDGILDTGVDLPEGLPPARSSEPSILFVGTWGGRKRGSLLHRVFADVVRRAIPRAELWMVSDQCEPAAGVYWHPHPSDGELTGLYRRAWVFCLPSAYEGLGLPYLEAMSHGLPVVSTPNFGALSVLGGAGRLVGPAEIGPALAELLRASELRAELSRLGRARAEEFSWRRVVDQHERAYELAIDRWSTSRLCLRTSRAHTASRRVGTR